jgi:hypothetical protein
MKKFLIALSIFSLTGCATNPLASPAPLASTTIDEKGLIIALQTFDTLLTAVDKLVAVGVITAGSPHAIAMADAINKAKIAYQAASAAQRAGNSASYITAIGQAQVAIANINQLVKGN